MENVINNRKSTRKHENNLCKSLFLILGFDPDSTLLIWTNPYFLFSGLTLTPLPHSAKNAVIVKNADFICRVPWLAWFLPQSGHFDSFY